MTTLSLPTRRTAVGALLGGDSLHGLATREAAFAHGNTVISIDLVHRIARLDDLSEIHFGSLISTMPIDRLVELTEVPAELRGRIRQLKRNRVTVVGVGMQGTPPEDLPQFTWI